MPAFVDTNVAVYALGRDTDKKMRARQILDASPVVSSQVINEAISVLTRKQALSRDEAYEVAEALMALAAVVSVSAGIVRDAIAIGRRHAISHWDALIVAAALAAGCDTLYSEDMQDGQVFDGRLTVKNPF